MNGEKVRAMILDSGLPFWKVAERFGCSPSWFSVKLRHDFTKDEVERLQAIIEELKTA